MTRRIAGGLGLCGVLLAPAVLTGQTTAAPAPLRLTLDEAIRRGLDTSHRIGEAVARGEAAQAVVGERHAAALPLVSAQGGYTRTNHVDEFGLLMPDNIFRIIYPDLPDNYRSRLDVQWPIYTGGRTAALESAARLDATAAADDITTARADLTLEITRAYWGIVTASDALRVVEESVRRIDAHLQDVRNQLAAGLVPPNDVLTVEAQESRQRMLAIQARGARDVAEAELARLIGAAAGTSIEPSAPVVPPAPSEQSAGTLVEIAKQQRPERAALVKRLDSATQRMRAAESGARPVVGVGGGFDYANPNPRFFPREDVWRTSWDASINVSWPVFDGGRTRSEIGEATAAARALRERLAEFDTTVAVEVRQRLTDLTSALAAIAAADDAVRSATEARRVVGDRFGAGVATSTDVLDAQVALLQAELDRTQAIANARMADARLTRTLGK